MPFDICLSCGATIADGAAFCQRCGTPRATAAPEDPRALQPASEGFELTAGALGLFGRSILLMIGMFLIVPAPWLVCWFNEWLVENIRGRDGDRAVFRGTPGSVWVLTTLYGLVMVANIVNSNREDPYGWLQAVVQVGSIALTWAYFRWFTSQVEFDGRRLNLRAGLPGYIGWNLLIYLSILTIVGWAWVTVFMYRWLTRSVEGTEGNFTFTAEGHQFLWRTVVAILFCLPIVTMPWAIKWMYSWLVSQVRFQPSSGAAGAAPVPVPQAATEQA